MVVEDYEPFRRFVCAALRKQWEFKIIEAVDGLDAIQKAQELQPDLILLDVGLPKLNGIEVARRILALRPKSKILFLSDNRSWDIVEEGLRSGAMGYVTKSSAATELLPAIESVLQGRRFLSASLTGGNLTSVTQKPTAAKQQLRIAESTRRHEVGFYSDDGRLLDDITQFIGAALNNGNAAIVVATASHCNGVMARLQSENLNIVAAIEQGRCVLLDVADALAAVLTDGVLDSLRFLKLIGGLILSTAEAAKTHTGEQGAVALFGGCAGLLWAQGKEDLAIQFEKLANQLLNTYDIEILCGYSLRSVQSAMQDSMFQRVCAEHSAVHHHGS
jgi:DNA-binding NarL/FixJ family response regulator